MKRHTHGKLLENILYTTSRNLKALSISARQELMLGILGYVCADAKANCSAEIKVYQIDIHPHSE
jgi:hypothetical protein